MQDARVRAALLLVCLVCLLGSAVVLFAGHHAAPPPVVITPPPPEGTASVSHPEAAPISSKPAARVYVDVAGCVRRPSLYVLPAESRIMQAIIAAGGPTADADMDAINLAQKVTDGEKVFVPKHNVAPTEEPASTEQDIFSPTLAPVAKKLNKGTKAGHGNKITAESGEQIDLNTATAEQLERLPSVGPSMAERILAYRQQAGSFGKIEDLMQVTGIGPKKFAKIAPCVKL
jgi:competence protein ComEA